MEVLGHDVPVPKKRAVLESLLARITSNRSGKPVPSTAQVQFKAPTPAAKAPEAPAAAPVPEKIDAFDSRWDAPSRPPLAKPVAAQPAKAEPAAPAAPEKIDAFDTRWDSKPSVPPPAPPVKVAAPAAVTAPVPAGTEARLRALLERVLSRKR